MDDRRFECQPGCTNCCRREGFVYMTEADVTRAAALLGLSAAEFERKYLFRTRHVRRLRKPRHSSCHFLSEDGCAIHAAKPTQCRAFPFWPELIEGEGESAWNSAGGYCPGIGKGPLVQIEAARETARDMRAAYPRLYRGV